MIQSQIESQSQRQSQIQVGGKLLGQGVYGCTFDPAPRCAGGSVFKKIAGKDAVGKLTSEDAGEELAIGKAIMALPLAAQYFALPSAGCRPQMPIIDPDAKGCRVITTSGEGTKFSLLIMPAAGKQLAKYAYDLKHLADNYKRIFIHLLEGAVIYQRAGYVHNDIHMGNILIDDNNVARFIDFGLAFKLDTIQTWEDANLGMRFRPKYLWQAPEVHAWRMVRNGIHLDEGVRQLKEVNPEYAILERQFPKRGSVYAVLENLLATSKEVAQRDGVGFIRKFGKGFDAWRIGVCMWMIWDDLITSQGFTGSRLYGERELIRKVMSGLTDFDPRSRISVADALLLLDPVNRLAATT